MRKMQRMMMATVVRHITTQRMRQSWKGVTLKKPKSFQYDSPAPILQISGCAVRLGKEGQSGASGQGIRYAYALHPKRNNSAVKNRKDRICRMRPASAIWIGLS